MTAACYWPTAELDFQEPAVGSAKPWFVTRLLLSLLLLLLTSLVGGGLLTAGAWLTASAQAPAPPASC
jgi:hypothetical protein